MTDSTSALNSNNLINNLESSRSPAWVDDIIFYEDLANAFHASVNKSTAPGPLPPLLFGLATAGASLSLNIPSDTNADIVD
jgi:hypothetical protein